MSVTEVQAWRVSDGRCFGSKVEACGEEVGILYGSLPVRGKRGMGLGDFRKLVGEVREWLGRAELHLAGMDGERDVEVGKKVRGG